jgi:tetratricopeptide (TPR) repeat protein
MKPSLKLMIGLIILTLPIIGFSQNAKQYYKTGISFVESGNYKDAIEQFTKTIELSPDFTKAYIDRARSYEALNEFRKAADDYNRALVFETKDHELYFDAARLEFKLGNNKEALALVTKCTEISASYVEAYQLLSQIQIALDDYSGALFTINKALKLKDNSVNHYYHGLVSEKMKNYNQAELDYEKAISKNKQYVEAYLALSKLELLLNKLDKAMVNCESVFKISQNNKEAFLVRSSIYARQSEYPKAIDDISKILSGFPNDKEMYLIRGKYYQDFTQNQNAINDFTKAILLDNKFSEAFYKRAYSYEQVGDFKSAIKDYETLAALSTYDMVAKQHLDDAHKRLFELNREQAPPKIVLVEPLVFNDTAIKVAKNKMQLNLRGKIIDVSEITKVRVNNTDATLFKNGENFEFSADIDISKAKAISINATDVYENTQNSNYSIERTEITPPAIALIAPFPSDDGEIYMDTDEGNLYVEGSIADESLIKSILIDGVSASFMLNDLNPKFSATINIANKNKFTVTAVDVYGNDTSKTFTLNREGVSLLAANPMGRTWVIFIENSNYETFPSLDGPSKDITLMRSAMAGYDIQKVIHKQDMTKKEMERFFSIELRDLLLSNKVNTVLIWYAGHGKFINETGYWIPIDAKRDDEFTYYNLNTLRASMQSYTTSVTHTLVISDACESGPTFYQAMRNAPKERNCNDWQAVKFKSSQVFSSAGYELAVDNSQFTKTFANTLANNPNACLPIESVVNKVTTAVSQKNQQKPKFGKIVGLADEDGTFFFISKK